MTIFAYCSIVLVSTARVHFKIDRDSIWTRFASAVTFRTEMFRAFATRPTPRHVNRRVPHVLFDQAWPW